MPTRTDTLGFCECSRTLERGLCIIRFFESMRKVLYCKTHSGEFWKFPPSCSRRSFSKERIYFFKVRRSVGCGMLTAASREPAAGSDPDQCESSKKALSCFFPSLSSVNLACSHIQPHKAQEECNIRWGNVETHQN